MAWITFAYSLPKNKSSARVSLWRRLQRLGAIAPAGNVYVLPATDDCVESFQWLTQEIQTTGGQAIMFHCEQIEGMSEQALIELFCEARAKDYQAILDEANALESELNKTDAEEDSSIRQSMAKLRRQYADVTRIDYFDCPEGQIVENRLSQLEQLLAGGHEMQLNISILDTSDFQGKIWVTRPQPFVDRLASIWLIRRFIDISAEIRYSHQPENDGISFDMPNAQFGHTGNLCTFETLIKTFQISADGLNKIAEIIHEVDLHDGIYNHPETFGIDAVLKGWSQQGLSDQELEARGLVLMDGLLSAMG